MHNSNVQIGSLRCMFYVVHYSTKSTQKVPILRDLETKWSDTFIRRLNVFWLNQMIWIVPIMRKMIVWGKDWSDFWLECAFIWVRILWALQWLTCWHVNMVQGSHFLMNFIICLLDKCWIPWKEKTQVILFREGGTGVQMEKLTCGLTVLWMIASTDNMAWMMSVSITFLHATRESHYYFTGWSNSTDMACQLWKKENSVSEIIILDKDIVAWRKQRKWEYLKFQCQKEWFVI